ncbi:MAG: BppU family phage baseplate upper protein, partial [Opitutales bacterium]
MTTKSITLNVWQPNDVRVQVNQGEVNSRFLEIKILDKKKAFNLTGKTVIFYATKPDGNLIFNYCEIIDAQKGLINLAMTSQMSIVPGIMRDCEIDILD